MELRQLETLVWIATLKSFRAAADRLNITQPAISARIAALESELGSVLLHRTGHHVSLTSEGLRVARYAEQMLKLTDELKETIAGPGAAASSSVRIGTVGALVHAWLPQLIDDLRTQFPTLGIELHVDSPSNLRYAIVRREIDVALTEGSIYEPFVRHVHVQQCVMEWVASPDFDLPRGSATLEEIGRHLILTYPKGSQVYFEIESLFRANGIRPLQLGGSNSVAAIIRLVGKGLGIGVLPGTSVRDEIASGRLRAITTDVPLPVFEFVACYPADSHTDIGAIVAELAVKAANREPVAARRLASAGKL
jgi:DNA-binding transcriptional LysR family regulator